MKALKLSDLDKVSKLMQEDQAPSGKYSLPIRNIPLVKKLVKQGKMRKVDEYTYEIV